MNSSERLRQGATDSGPRPADFPLGSQQSRAAARAMLEARNATPPEKQLLVIVRTPSRRIALEPDTCVQILRDSGYIPTGPCAVVSLNKVPEELFVAGKAATEQWLRENGAELCAPRKGWQG
jgi:hypothetical protein